MFVSYRKPEDQLMYGAGRRRATVQASVLDRMKVRHGACHVVFLVDFSERQRLGQMGMPNPVTIEIGTDDLGYELSPLLQPVQLTVSASTEEQRRFIGDSGKFYIEKVLIP